jgi:dTDP-glucose pyrophosphorylase
METSTAFDLVILASGNASRLWPLTLETPKVMLSISGKPGIFHILEKVARHNVGKVVVVCSPENVNRIRQGLTHAFNGHRFEFFFPVQAANLGPADALQAAESCLGDSPVLLWLGDTLAEFPAIEADRNTIVASPVDDCARWCMIDADPNGRVIALLDKPEACALNLAVIGQYYFASGKRLRRAIAHGRELWRASGREFELSMVLDDYIREGELYVAAAESWIDYGTMETYGRCKQWIPERFFNEINVNAKGLLSKKSENANIVEEMLWYSSIPEDCRILAPRKLAENLLENSYDIEYIDYKTLSEYFIFHPIHPQTWAYAADSLIALMNEHFWGRPVHIPDIQKRTRMVYHDKTVERIDEYLPDLGIDLDAPLYVDGRDLGPVNELISELKALIPRLYENAQQYSSVIHGDLVFSNILCSFPKPIFRVIDPRGTFGKIGPFGDYRYELAKLRQCYDGMYDAIMHGLFDLRRLEQNRYELSIFPDRAEIARIFDETVARRLPVDMREIELIQILLLFSLIPMHHDRQKAMAYFLRACKILRSHLEVAIA